jgi:hypothetical protein
MKHGLFAVLLIVATQTLAQTKPAQRVPAGIATSDSPGAMALKSPQDIFKLVSPSVFIVEALDASGQAISMGSAVAVASDAIVTNDHVIAEGKAWRVRKGDRTWPASVTNDDPAHDICRLRVARLNARPVTLRHSPAVEVGERVYAVGSPVGLEISLSEGLVSGIRHVPTGDMIQITAPISKGSSGGGLFDSSGRLIGLTTSYIQGGQNLNFAVPASLIATLDSHPVTAASVSHEQEPVFRAAVLVFYGFELLKKRDPDGKADDKALTDALAAFVGAHQLEPDWAEPFFGIGLVDESLGDSRAAATAYENAVKRKPDDAVGWYSLGLQYQRLRDFDKAIIAHKTAVALKPDYCEGWARLLALYGLNPDRRRETVEAYMKVKELATVQGSNCQEYEQTLRPLVFP